MSDLKPCPFCGSDRIAFGRDIETTEIHGILCLSCKAQVRFPIEFGRKETFGENEEKWIKAWNRRMNDEPRNQPDP